MYSHILVPVDLDTPAMADRAMEVARELAERDGAKLTVVSVQPVIADETAMPPPDYQPKLDAYIEANKGDLEVEGVLQIGGSISGEIRRTAEERDVDLIVMASHEPRLSDYLIGSNAAHVTLHTPCSVLVVR